MPARYFRYALCACTVVTLLTSNANAADFTLRPTRATGVENVDWFHGPGDREITLAHGNQTVEVFGYISNFAPQDIGGYQAGLNCPDFIDGELTASDIQCFADVPGTDFCMGTDESQPTYVLAEASGTLGGCQDVELCPDDIPGHFVCGKVSIFGTGTDQGIEHYALQFAFNVFADARGSYNLSFDDDPNRTLIRDGMAQEVPVDNVFPATVTVAVGACCLPAPGCAGNLTIRECDDLGGTFYADTSCSGPDSDNDGNPDICDICIKLDDFADEDGDNVPDGCDSCPGVNNIEFPDCFSVPTVSHYGLLVLALALLCLARILRITGPRAAGKNM